MNLEQPLQQFLDELASEQPTPGGGSAAALSGAVAAALASMVARLTIGRAGYEAVQQEIEELLQQSEQLRVRFQQLVQEDIEAYGRLSSAYKMPRGTAEEKSARSRSIQAHLVEAALVPLEVAECAASLLRCCQRIAEIGNVNVLSDIAVAAALASSAATGAAWMVRVNLRSLKDLEMANILSRRLSAALDEITERSQEIVSIVGSRE